MREQARPGPLRVHEPVSYTHLRRVAALHGAQDKYHDTITRSWLHFVAVHMQRWGADDFDEFLERKLEVIGAYGSQVKVRRYLQEDLLRATARYWSRYGASHYAEPLEVIRDNEVAPVPAESASSDPQIVTIEARVL